MHDTIHNRSTRHGDRENCLQKGDAGIGGTRVSIAGEIQPSRVTSETG
jgi:hypothetical protein